jgi:hypothetical protein
MTLGLDIQGDIVFKLLRETSYNYLVIFQTLETDQYFEGLNLSESGPNILV